MKPSSMGQCISRTSSRVRRILLASHRLRRLPIEYRIHSLPLLMPLGHALPAYRAHYPDYGENLGRIARAVCTKYPAATIVDVGGNVGDSAAILRHYAGGVPILCIEPADEYYPYLRHNSVALGGEICCLQAIVDGSAGAILRRLTAASGTARLVASESRKSVQALSLGQILESFPRFAVPKLIKLDTDGFDGRILAGAIGLIQKVRPVIFWEFDPWLDSAAEGPGTALFPMLEEAGYTRLMVYANTGDYLLSVSLGDHAILGDLASFYTGRRSTQYADLCAFPEEDTDLAGALREEELRNVQERPRFVSRV